MLRYVCVSVCVRACVRVCICVCTTLWQWSTCDGNQCCLSIGASPNIAAHTYFSGVCQKSELLCTTHVAASLQVLRISSSLTP